ncbi:MAG: DegV family protein [Corallococcus sp.]|nr:DegV family protein [Bacillota bacterium]MCM1533091.1 DegV family protein [Corallococcus sp.]
MTNYLLFMDVSGDVDKQYVDEGKVELLPMEFIINGTADNYTDKADGINVIDFYAKVKARADIKTTQITPAVYEEYFDKYLKAGNSVLYLCLSSGLSSTYQSACIAAENFKKKYPDVEMLVVDTLRATGCMGTLCEKMIANKDKGMSLRDNYYDLEVFKYRLDACAYVDDLNALQRGGRIGKGTAVIGTMFDIKPLITFTPDGKLRNWGKQRGIKMSIKKLVEFYAENADLESSYTIYICHADEETNAKELAEKVRAVSPSCVIKTRLLSPIIGAHLGPGALVLCFTK